MPVTAEKTSGTQLILRSFSQGCNLTLRMHCGALDARAASVAVRACVRARVRAQRRWPSVRG
eukprot:3722894-Alexandrium_andersonii.AAC.1